MESIVAATITGALTLLGVLVSNSRSRAVMETKIEEPTRRVEMHSRVVERTFRLEQDIAVAERDIEALSEKTGSPMSEFLTSNEWYWRLARTIAQGILGVVVANIDVLMGAAVVNATWCPICVALVMAVLSPVMAELGAHAALPEGGEDDGR